MTPTVLLHLNYPHLNPPTNVWDETRPGSTVADGADRLDGWLSPGETAERSLLQAIQINADGTWSDVTEDVLAAYHARFSEAAE